MSRIRAGRRVGWLGRLCGSLWALRLEVRSGLSCRSKKLAERRAGGTGQGKGKRRHLPRPNIIPSPGVYSFLFMLRIQKGKSTS